MTTPPCPIHNFDYNECKCQFYDLCLDCNLYIVTVEDYNKHLGHTLWDSPSPNYKLIMVTVNHRTKFIWMYPDERGKFVLPVEKLASFGVRPHITFTVG